MAPEVPKGKVHNVDPKDRNLLLKKAGDKDGVVLDLRGSKYLPPKDRAIVESKPRSSASFPVEKSIPDPFAAEPWFYNPSNPAASCLPADVPLSRYQEITRAITKIDRNMAFTFHPERRVWQLWYYKPGFCTFGNGWVMMKEFEPFRNTAYILETVKFMDMQSRGITLKELYAQKKQERIDAKNKARKDRIDRDREKAGEVYDYTTIKNIGKGSKFADYHS